ncbi:hypothetical protein ECPA31_1838, partial [Escherichia coli PA31]
MAFTINKVVLCCSQLNSQLPNRKRNLLVLLVAAFDVLLVSFPF